MRIRSLRTMTSHSASSDCWLNTVPVGLLGQVSTTALVFSVQRDSNSAASNTKPFSSLSGTNTGVPPAIRVYIALVR